MGSFRGWNFYFWTISIHSLFNSQIKNVVVRALMRLGGNDCKMSSFSMDSSMKDAYEGKIL